MIDELNMSEGRDVRYEITDPDAILYRVIAGAHYQAGAILPAAFSLTSADKKEGNRLSMSQAKEITAHECYRKRNAAIRDRNMRDGNNSPPPAGVLALSVATVNSVEIIDNPPDGRHLRPLSAWDDSMCIDKPDDHAHIDFNSEDSSGAKWVEDRGKRMSAAKQLIAGCRSNDEVVWEYFPHQGVN